MRRTKVLLDCDPGYDDAVAIMLACAAKELDVLGITTVAGNQTVDKTFVNARKMLTLLDADIPVARGCSRPLLRELRTGSSIHGETGLDGVELPAPIARPYEGHAVNFIIETLKASTEQVVLIPVAPLTNIATAFTLTPEVKERVARIVLMGGAAAGGNVTPAAEFNIYVDPEAARIVFESGVPITMIGLDVTNRALFTRADIQELGRRDGQYSRVCAAILSRYADSTLRASGVDGARLHDPLAVATVIDPAVVSTAHLHVDIETHGEFTHGATVVDVRGRTGKPQNADVALDLDFARFRQLLFDALAVLDARQEERLRN